MLKIFGDVKVGDKIYCFIDTEFLTREVENIREIGVWALIMLMGNDTIQVRKTDTHYNGSYVCIEELIEDVTVNLNNAIRFRDKESAHA